jgi:hypothetical protein
MTRKVKKFVKKIGHAYMEGVMEMYGPAINAGLLPFI